MKLSPITVALLAAGSLVLTLSSSAQEQRPQGGPGRRGPGGEGGPMRVNPIVAALDANSDGILSAEEIANAPVALKKLDKNGDGKLTEDELRPNFGRGQGGPGAVAPADLVKRLLEYDKNNDGKLAKDVKDHSKLLDTPPPQQAARTPAPKAQESNAQPTLPPKLAEFMGG